MKNKDEIGKKMEKKDRKILIQKLIGSWKEEDLKNPHISIYNLCIDDEKNQYGFSMMKPLLEVFLKRKNQ